MTSKKVFISIYYLLKFLLSNLVLFLFPKFLELFFTQKTHKTYQGVMQSETALNSALCIENKDCVSATYNILILISK